MSVEGLHGDVKLRQFCHHVCRIGGVVTSNGGNFDVIIGTEKELAANAVTVDSEWSMWHHFAIMVLCRLLRMAFLPLFSGVVSLAPRWRSWRSISFGRSFSCKGQKRSRHIDTPIQAGVVPPLWFLYGCGYVTGPYCLIQYSLLSHEDNNISLTYRTYVCQ